MVGRKRPGWLGKESASRGRFQERICLAAARRRWRKGKRKGKAALLAWRVGGRREGRLASLLDFDNAHELGLLNEPSTKIGRKLGGVKLFSSFTEGEANGTWIFREETSLIEEGGKVGLGNFGRLLKRFHNQNRFVVSPELFGIRPPKKRKTVRLETNRQRFFESCF